jgi:predicted DNA-binding transcriptional regulator YafY
MSPMMRLRTCLGKTQDCVVGMPSSATHAHRTARTFVPLAPATHPLSRSVRLLQLLQMLRRHRRAVSAAALADELSVSLRTVYRDLAALKAQGADIEGAPGIGYRLRPGYTLPPLMLTTEEVDALVLGTRWVIDHADRRLAGAARDALAKIAAIVPGELRHDIETSPLLPGPAAMPAGDAELTAVRDAMRRQEKLIVRYRDTEGRLSERTLWPVALGFFDQMHVLIAWCELRGSIRHFRIDRIVELRRTGTGYPRSRHAVLAQWRAQEGIGPDEP